VDAKLSRRSLFRGVAGGGEETAKGLVARVSAGCVERAGVACRRCGEVCPANAIRFRPLGAGRAELVLAEDVCTGCGECAPLCPVAAIALVARDRVALMAGLVELERAS